LEGYAAGMLRLDPPIQGGCREVKADETVGSTSLSAGDLVYANIVSANVNASSRVFRLGNSSYDSLPKEHYIRDDVLTRTLGTELMSKIVVKVLKAVFELKNVTLGPGQSGELKR